MQAVITAVAPDLYQTHVNPQWAKLLDLLEMNVQYVTAAAAGLASSGALWKEALALVRGITNI